MTTALEQGVTVSLRLRFEGTVMRSTKGRGRRASRMIQQKDAEGADGESQVLTQEEEDALERKRDLVEELIGEEKDDEHTHHPDVS